LWDYIHMPKEQMQELCTQTLGEITAEGRGKTPPISARGFGYLSISDVLN